MSQEQKPTQEEVAAEMSRLDGIAQAWHTTWWKSPRAKPLHKHMGLTGEEYRAWVADPVEFCAQKLTTPPTP